MIYPKQKYQHDKNYIRVGWMTGFIWQTTSLYSQSDYVQIWHHDQQKPFQWIHLELEKTKQLKEHYIVAVFELISLTIRIISALLVVISILSYQNNEQQSQYWGSLGFINTVIILITPIIVMLSKFCLHLKLKAYLLQLNQYGCLKKNGYKINFPQYDIWFLCFKLPEYFQKYLFDVTDYSTIEVWQSAVNNKALESQSISLIESQNSTETR